MPKCIVPLRYRSTFSSCLSFCAVGFVKLLARVCAEKPMSGLLKLAQTKAPTVSW